MSNKPYLITPQSFDGETRQFPGLITAIGPRTQNGDWLALTLTTSDATGTVRLTARLLRDDGEIVVTTELMTFSGTGSQTAIVARLSDGWLQGFDVSVASGTITDGEVVAAVHLGTGEGGLRSYQCCLASGEITNIRSLGLGAFLIRGPETTTSQPTIEANKPANPAAGAQLTWTVPVGEVWEIQSLYVELVTDGTASNRRVGYAVTDGASALVVAYAEQNHTASLTRVYSMSRGTEMFQALANTNLQIALATLMLPAGWTIGTSVINMQAGDQIQNGRLAYRQY